MRRLFILVISCLPHLCAAQQWNITGLGGALWNSRSGNPEIYEKASELGGAASFGLSYQRGGLEAGAFVAYRRYSFRLEGDLMDNYDTVTKRGTLVHIKDIVRFPSVAVGAVINRHVACKTFDWYGGLSIAYIRFQDIAAHSGVTQRDNSRLGENGVSGDIHAGLLLPLFYERFSLCAEASVGTVIFTWEQTTSIATCAVMAGIRYRLSRQALHLYEEDGNRN